jgi:hypothetical protein
MSGSLFNRVREMNRVVGGAAHHCASPGAAERIQDWVLGGVAADTDRRSFGARRPHASRSHQHTTYAEPLGGVGGRREQEGRVLAIAGVDTAPGRVRPEANPLVDATSTRGREPPHHQEITHIDKEKTKKRSKELDNCGHIEGEICNCVASALNATAGISPGDVGKRPSSSKNLRWAAKPSRL